MTTKNSCVEILLSEALIISQKAQTRKSEAITRGEAFNVFSLCGVDHYELVHSRIVAGLLDPSGSHGQGNMFLEPFLRMVVDDKICSRIINGNPEVVTEYVTPEDGRIDIIIQDRSKSFAVIIENKIYAADQDAQLKRYAHFASNQYKEGEFKILYLTLDGSEASEQSAEGVDYSRISYSYEIRNWLSQCISLSATKPLIRETLVQYKNHIDKLTGCDMENKSEKEIVAAMMRAPAAAGIIISAKSAWEREIVESKLFEPLRSFAEERCLTFEISPEFFSKKAWASKISFIITDGLKIQIENNASNWRSFYCGVIDTRQDKRPMSTLPSLSGYNESWRYGWKFLEMHPDWTVNDLAIIAEDDGEFVRYICTLVDQLMRELKDKNII